MRRHYPHIHYEETLPPHTLWGDITPTHTMRKHYLHTYTMRRHYLHTHYEETLPPHYIVSNLGCPEYVLLWGDPQIIRVLLTVRLWSLLTGLICEVWQIRPQWIGVCPCIRPLQHPSVTLAVLLLTQSPRVCLIPSSAQDVIFISHHLPRRDSVALSLCYTLTVSRSMPKLCKQLIPSLLPPNSNWGRLHSEAL